MKAIWKFELRVTDIQKVALPLNSRILCVQAFSERVGLWKDLVINLHNGADPSALSNDTNLKFAVERAIDLINRGKWILSGNRRGRRSQK